MNIKKGKPLNPNNPYTNKKPCIHHGPCERYNSPPYQCKQCQRAAARQRHIDIALAEQEETK